MRDIAIGVMAYNEETNIGTLLRSILRQTLDARVARIVVVSSGSTDRTGDRVRELSKTDARIELIEEPRRSGKIAAINAFLAVAREPLLIVSCGDLIFEPKVVETLVRPLEDPAVGMSGAHPVPLNDATTFVGFAVQLMWELHHRISLVDPKMGELIAFRNVIDALDVRALEDELLIERCIRRAGFSVAYAADAVVHNRGPQTLAEFLRQRTRCIVANLQVADEYRVFAPTMSARRLAAATSEYLRERRSQIARVLAVAALEAWCRARAIWDYRVVRRREHYRVWEPISSTKTLSA